MRPTETGGELETLTQLLDFLRATVVHKATGVTDDDGRSTLLPSSLSISAIVRHLTGVERFWFTIDFAGADVEWPWDDSDPGAFLVEPAQSLTGLVAAYEQECEASRRAIQDASLDDLARGQDVNFNLRYALVHLIEETARHCGHLDLLREAIDGSRGE